MSFKILSLSILTALIIVLYLNGDLNDIYSALISQNSFRVEKDIFDPIAKAEKQFLAQPYIKDAEKKIKSLISDSGVLDSENIEKMSVTSLPPIIENEKFEGVFEARTKIEDNKRQTDSLKKEIEAKKSEIKEMWPKSGPKYTEKVNELNKLISNYNSLIKDTEELIRQYNDSVEEPDICGSVGGI